MSEEKVEISLSKLNLFYRLAFSRDRSRSGWAGAAMTEYQCVKCDKHCCHGSTSTPLLCDDCTDEIEDQALGEMAKEAEKDESVEFKP